ncbi:hypothetical protein FOA52_007810 [Chlamydomonas sp. UWO 241]|nr:hypothetical protein FOA52_007810 [Chlamydomonas sp. UWO 241]
MATAADEVAGLDRVLTRLATTEDTNLEKVLLKLVPLVISKLATTHDAVRKKVLEILSHVNKRVKGQPSIKLPVAELLPMVSLEPAPGAPHAPPADQLAMVRSFALVYLEMAFERAPADARLEALSPLLVGLSSRPPQHRAICLRLSISALEALAGTSTSAALALPAAVSATATTADPGSSASAAHEKAREAALAKYPFLGVPADRDLFLEHVLKFLLYQPRSSVSKAQTPLQAAAAAAATPAAATAAEEPACPGLSILDMKMLEEKGGTAPEVLPKRKAGLVGLLAAASAGLGANAVLLPLIAGATDPAAVVSTRCDELLKRVCGLDSGKPSVDLEDAALVGRLMRMFHGNAEGTVRHDGLAVEARTQAASTPVATRLMSLFVRSIAAANAFPATVQTVSECIYGPRSNVRLKQQGMEFAVWVFKHADLNHLKAMGPGMLTGLLASLEEGDRKEDMASLAMRGFAYQAVGSMAQRLPALLSGRTDVAQMFFRAVSEEPSGLRATVAEATSALAGAFKAEQLSREQADELEALLLSSIASHKDTVRVCAVQWANRLFPFTHAPARYVCVLATGDPKHEVREEGLRGLRLHPSQQATALALQAKQLGEGGVPGAATAAAPTVQLRDLLVCLRKNNAALFAGSGPGRSLALPPKAFVALLQLAKSAAGGPDGPPAAPHDPEQMADAGDDEFLGGPGAPLPPGYLLLLEGALCRDTTGELCSSALQDLLATGAVDAPGLRARYAPRTAWLRGFASHNDAGARAAAARLIGAVAPGIDSTPALEALLTGLTAAFSGGNGGGGAAASAAAATAAAGVASGTELPAPPGATVLGGASVHGSHVAGSTKFEEQEGCILAAGYVLAQCLSGAAPGPGLPRLPDAASSAAAAALARCVASPPGGVSALAAAAAVALGLASLRGPLPLAPSAAPVAAPAATMEVDAPPAEGGPAAAVDAAAPAVAAAAAPAAAAVAAPAAAVVAAAPAEGSLAAVLVRVAELTGDREVKVAVRAVTAAGQLMAGYTGNPAVTKPLLECLVKLAFSKSEEIQFAVGDALAYAFGGVPVSADELLLTNFGGLAEHFSLLSLQQGDAAPAQKEADVAPGLSDSVEAACPEAVAATRTWLTDKLLDVLVVHTRAEVRCASAVWAVCLLTYCRGPAATAHLAPLLGRVQEAMGHLLGDTNELTQEMASRGISLVYQRGDEATRKGLVEALVGVLQGGAKAKQAVKLSGDTEVFEAGVLGTGPPQGSAKGGASGDGGNLSTYRELCSLATDLGQPDLIYKFMDLAHHNQAINTRRGASFGLAGIARLAGGQLGPHVAALVPKLYRYQYDPNPKVQDAMVHIWRSLIDDPKKTIDLHFQSIMRELLREMGGRLWRNRQAACAALADLLQGRRFAELAPHLEEVWTMTLRCLDDIKETVRAQAMALVRCVRSLTLRLVDPQFTSKAECGQAVGLLLPLLLEKGLGSSVREVKAIALDAVAKTVKLSTTEALKPQLVPLVEAMLEGLSSLEDTRLNYVEQHAERMNFDNDKLEAMRVSASRASPMGDTLELCSRFADAATLEALTPMLSGIVSRGVGLNSKVGTARFIRSLMARATKEDAKPVAPTLLRVLLLGAHNSRSGTVRKAYAGAAAQVLKHCTDKRVQKSVTDACELYSGTDANSDSKYMGGLILHEILRASPETFAGYAGTVLPLAFSAKMDEDKEVAGVWKEVWEEGISSEAGAVRLYTAEIVGSLVAGMGSTQWGHKRTCAEAVVQLTQLGGDLLGAHASRLASALLAEVGGRLWDGKECMLDALGALSATAASALTADPGHGPVVEALMGSLSRKKASYCTAGIKALTKALPAFKADYFDSVSPPLLAVCEAHVSLPSAMEEDKPKGGEGGEEEAPKPLPLPESLQCLVAAFQQLPGGGDKSAGGAGATDMDVDGGAGDPAAVATLEAHGGVVVTTLVSLLSANLPWQQHAAAVATAAAVCAHAPRAGGVHARWAGELLPPVSAFAATVKVQQARLSALACMTELLKGPGGVGALPARAREAAAAAAEVASGDKSAAVVAAATAITTLLA